MSIQDAARKETYAGLEIQTAFTDASNIRVTLASVVSDDVIAHVCDMVDGGVSDVLDVITLLIIGRVGRLG
jgi:hypothetical protein